jgi:hypothetical protein
MITKGVTPPKMSTLGTSGAILAMATTFRRMGGAAWRRLHRLVYRVAILAAPHFVWLAKAVRWMWWRGVSPSEKMAVKVGGRSHLGPIPPTVCKEPPRFDFRGSRS